MLYMIIYHVILLNSLKYQIYTKYKLSPLKSSIQTYLHLYKSMQSIFYSILCFRARGFVF